MSQTPPALDGACFYQIFYFALPLLAEFSEIYPIMYCCLLTGTDNVDFSLFPSRDYQLVWLRMYLEEAAVLKGESALSWFVDVCMCTYMCDLIINRNGLVLSDMDWTGVTP